VEDLLVGLLEAAAGLLLLLACLLDTPLQFLDLVVRVLLALGEVG
jgi:hypothetical protein